MGERPDYTIPAADDAPDLDLGDLFEPQEKTPAREPTLTDILGSPPAYEERYDDFHDYGVETEDGEASDGEASAGEASAGEDD